MPTHCSTEPRSLQAYTIHCKEFDADDLATALRHRYGLSRDAIRRDESASPGMAILRVSIYSDYLNHLASFADGWLQAKSQYR